MTALEQLAAHSSLLVLAWEDPVVDALGHDPRSEYVERFWLPILGPSTICLLRHLASCLERSPKGCTIDLDETARALGLGMRPGPNGPFQRTITRAVDFEMARVHHNGLQVRRRMPPLPRRHLSRLPEAARNEHEVLIANGANNSGLAEMRRRGRQLALSLVRLGEDAASTERQLGQWRFHPGLAHECALWAEQTARGEAALAPAASAT